MKGFENVPPHGKRERGSEKKPEAPRQPIPEVAETISSKEQPPRNMTPIQNISRVLIMSRTQKLTSGL